MNESGAARPYAGVRRGARRSVSWYENTLAAAWRAAALAIA
jgi:hypothetical protein